jgi:DNA adenine methylase
MARASRDHDSDRHLRSTPPRVGVQQQGNGQEVLAWSTGTRAAEEGEDLASVVKGLSDDQLSKYRQQFARKGATLPHELAIIDAEISRRAYEARQRAASAASVAGDDAADVDAGRKSRGVEGGERYEGGKGVDGVYQFIIRQMPPHQLYVEAFAGHGAILRNKRPAASSTLIDIDPKVIAWWEKQQRQKQPIPNLSLMCGDALDMVPNALALGGAAPDQTLLYFDPEYLESTQAKGRYPKHPFRSESQHKRLLTLLLQLAGRGYMIMLSGYYSPLYGAMLRGWYLHKYPAGNRRREECLWCSFPPPPVIHDIRYAGESFRERLRIKRKVANWVKMFAKMKTPLERQVIFEALAEFQRQTCGQQPSGNVAGDAGDRQTNPTNSEAS